MNDIPKPFNVAVLSNYADILIRKGLVEKKKFSCKDNRNRSIKKNKYRINPKAIKKVVAFLDFEVDDSIIKKSQLYAIHKNAFDSAIKQKYNGFWYIGRFFGKHPYFEEIDVSDYETEDEEDLAMVEAIKKLKPQKTQPTKNSRPSRSNRKV